MASSWEAAGWASGRFWARPGFHPSSTAPGHSASMWSVHNSCWLALLLPHVGPWPGRSAVSDRRGPACSAPDTQVFKGQVPASHHDHSLRPEALMAKKLPAYGRLWGGATCLPTCFQVGISEIPPMNPGPQRLHGDEGRHRGQASRFPAGLLRLLRGRAWPEEAASNRLLARCWFGVGATDGL